MKKTNFHKEFIINLKKELKLSKEDVLLFLDLSSSTYDKILSDKVNRSLPKKSMLIVKAVFHTDDLDEIKLLCKNQKIQFKIKQKIRYRKIIEKKGFDHLLRYNDLFCNILESDNFTDVSNEEIKNLEYLISKEQTVDFILRFSKLIKYLSSGEIDEITEKDKIILGFYTVLLQKENNEEIVEKLKEIANKLIIKVDIKFKDDDLFNL